jgi:hypothetical protein
MSGSTELPLTDTIHGRFWLNAGGQFFGGILVSASRLPATE